MAEAQITHLEYQSQGYSKNTVQIYHDEHMTNITTLRDYGHRAE
jgi:hypothetical protein